MPRPASRWNSPAPTPESISSCSSGWSRLQVDGQDGSPRPARAAASSYQRAIVSDGEAGSGINRHPGTLNDRAAVLFAKTAETAKLFIRKVFVPFGEVIHGIVEPFLLMLKSCFQDAATQDVTEQLVTGLINKTGSGFSAGRFPFCHSRNSLGLLTGVVGVAM